MGWVCEPRRERQLEDLLEIADSSLTYRSRYLTSMRADLVLDLLLLDEANPRSVAFQLARLREHIERLPESDSSVRRPAEWRLGVRLLTAVQIAELSELVREDEAAAGRTWSTCSIASPPSCHCSPKP